MKTFLLLALLAPAFAFAAPMKTNLFYSYAYDDFQNPDSKSKFDAELSKGNVCLASLKKDLEALQADPEAQALCQKAADVASLVVASTCQLDLAVYKSQFSLTLRTVYPRRNSSRGYAVQSSHHLQSSDLPKTWAAAIEADACHLNAAKVKEELRRVMKDPENNILTFWQRRKLRKQASAEEKLRRADCQKANNKLTKSMNEELERIKTYIPEKWLTGDERLAVETARIEVRATHGTLPTDCVESDVRLRDVLANLRKIRSREQRPVGAPEAPGEPGGDGVGIGNASR